MARRRKKREYKIINTHPEYASEEERLKAKEEFGKRVIPIIYDLVNSANNKKG